MSLEPPKTKTGVICKFCKWDDAREFIMIGSIQYVCPNCSRSWVVVEPSVSNKEGGD